MDTFPYVDRAFRHDFDAAPHRVYPHLTTVGEIFHRDSDAISYFAGGVAHQGIVTGLDTPFDFPVYFALRDVLAHDKPMTELATVLRQDALYPRPTWPELACIQYYRKFGRQNSGVEFANFPAFFPVSREFGPENDSHDHQISATIASRSRSPIARKGLPPRPRSDPFVARRPL